MGNEKAKVKNKSRNMSGNLDIVFHEDQMSTEPYEHGRNSNFTGHKVLLSQENHFSLAEIDK